MILSIPYTFYLVLTQEPRLLKRKRSDDVFEGLPDKRLCIRGEGNAESSEKLTLDERRYMESRRDLHVCLSTLSDKVGMVWAYTQVSQAKSRIEKVFEAKEKKVLKKEGRGGKRGAAGGSRDAGDAFAE